MAYIFDTNIWIDLISRRYPEFIFSTLHENIENKIGEGEVISHASVYDEIKRKDDTVFEKVKSLKSKNLNLFEGSPHEQQQWIKDNTSIIKDLGRGADGFLVAKAKLSNGILVTDEGMVHQEGKTKKIPNVCKDLGIRHVNFIGFMKEMRWKF